MRTLDSREIMITQGQVPHRLTEGRRLRRLEGPPSCHGLLRDPRQYGGCPSQLVRASVAQPVEPERPPLGLQSRGLVDQSEKRVALPCGGLVAVYFGKVAEPDLQNLRQFLG